MATETNQPTDHRQATLLRQVSELRESLLQEETRLAHCVAMADSSYAASVRNLLHYLALRQRDLRPLQGELAASGLSSLGRSESHVLATVSQVLDVLGQLQHRAIDCASVQDSAADAEAGRALLLSHAERLLGQSPAERGVRIMVTMPDEAAYRYETVRDLLAAGMDCMRINCAHGDADDWRRMVEHLHQAIDEVGRPCQIMMDLAGPKLRTGPLAPGPQVVRIRPQRDELGRVIRAAHVWLGPTGESAPSEVDAYLPVAADWLSEVNAGDELVFHDARDRDRAFRVIETHPAGLLAEIDRTAYLTTGMTLLLRPAADALEKSQAEEPRVVEIGAVPAIESPLRLFRGDPLLLTQPTQPGRGAERDAAGNLLRPAAIGCTLPEIFRDVRVGERIMFDDGRIGGVIRQVDADCIEVEITHARPSGEKLRSEKGINLPDSNLQVMALTDKDERDLEFIVRHADAVAYSFVRSSADVAALQSRLAKLGGEQLGILLKIETTQAFANLPSLLMTAMRSPAVGVMIARGDLAVECGYQRLAEVQEEILWMCEAAHLPVIWATQVLESLAKEGRPSRAEITDAAMGVRAECVMLNKGPYIVEAVETLDGILRRMQDHQSKKRSMLRRLEMAHIASPQETG